MPRIASTTTAGTPVDPTGGMTLDALMARQKALADRAGDIAAPRPMTSPWQGVAQMAQAFVNARQENTAAEQETAGRQHLASIMAARNPETGYTPQQISEMSVIDPQAAQRAQEAMAQMIHDKKLMEQQTALQSNQQTFQHGENVFNKDAAAEAAAKAAAQPDSPEGQIMQDFTNKVYGDPSTPEAQALRDAALKKATTVTSGNTASDRKVLYDQQDQYIQTSGTIGSLSRAKELLDQGINTGYTSGLRTMAGAAGLPGADADLAKRTKEFNSIMNQEAILAMAASLKGATSNQEMTEFITNMNDPTLDPTVKAKQIDRMLAKARSFNEQQGLRIKQMDPTAELPTSPAATKLDPAAEEALLAGARDAIAKGADPALVKKRLSEKGGDPGKL